MDKQDEIIVGVISDTHGRLAPAAISALQGVHLIIHAGDLDHEAILEQLKKIAPVKAVRGNMDRGHWAQKLPRSEVVEVGEASLYVLHNLENLDLHPGEAGFQAVIYGHSHRPEIRDRGGILFINPGSASMPRGGHPPSVVKLRVKGKELKAQFIKIGH